MGFGFGFGVVSPRNVTNISPSKSITTGLTITERWSVATPLLTRIVEVTPSGVSPGTGGMMNTKRSSEEPDNIS